MSYGKIYPSMFTGSLCGSGALVFAVMGYAIANARPDFNSTVSLNPKALSGILGEPACDIQDAIRMLCEPDQYSRSTEEEGRRLVRIGDSMDYRVVNLEKYRFLDREEQREYWRKAKQMQRKAKNVPACPGQMRTVLHTDADADADACTKNKSTRTPKVAEKTETKRPTIDEIKLFCAKSGMPESDAVWFFHKCEGNGWTNGGKPIKRWTSTLIAWKAAGYLPSQKVNISIAPAAGNSYGKPPVRDWLDTEYRKLGIKT